MSETLTTEENKSEDEKRRPGRPKKMDPDLLDKVSKPLEPSESPRSEYGLSVGRIGFLTIMLFSFWFISVVTWAFGYVLGALYGAKIIAGVAAVVGISFILGWIFFVVLAVRLKRKGK